MCKHRYHQSVNQFGPDILGSNCVRRISADGIIVDWLQSLNNFSYHILVASLTLIAIRVRLAISIWYDPLMKNCLRTGAKQNSYYQHKTPPTAVSYLVGYGWTYIIMGESSKFPKSWTFEISIVKLAVWPLNIHNFKIKWSIGLGQTENKSEKRYSILRPWWLSVECHLQNPEFRNNPENFHPWIMYYAFVFNIKGHLLL